MDKLGLEKIHVASNRSPITFADLEQLDCIMQPELSPYRIGAAGGLAVGLGFLLTSGYPFSLYSLPMTKGDRQIISGKHDKILSECFGIEGFPGIGLDSIDSRHKRVDIKHGDVVFDNNFIDISDRQRHNHYNGWSNQVLWPKFHNFSDEFLNHNFPDLSDINPKQGWKWYKNYQMTNMDMARAIGHNLLNKGEKEVVIINDYQLMLAANYLPGDMIAPMGYFHHITVPPAERTKENLSSMQKPMAKWVKDCIAGPLNCDFAGFHVPEWRDNFAETVQECLDDVVSTQLNDGTWLVEHPLGRCIVGDVPMGVDYEKIEREAKKTINHKVQTGAEQWQEFWELIDTNHLNIGSLGRLDYTKGDKYLIEIVRHMHGMYMGDSELKSKLQSAGKGEGPYLHQVGQPSRQDIPEYLQLMQDVFEQNLMLNLETGGKTTFYYEGLPFPHAYRFEANMDIMAVPTLADGQNLVALESIAAKAHLPYEKRGIVVIGENSGAAYTLKAPGHDGRGLDERDGVVFINPMDVESSAEKIYHAYLNHAITDRAIDKVRSMPVDNWFTELVRASHDAKKMKYSL